MVVPHKIKFATQLEGFNCYFTNAGEVFYTVTKKSKSYKENEEREEEHPKVTTSMVKVRWKNCSENYQILPAEEFNYPFGFLLKNEDYYHTIFCKGYKKLVLKNIYDKIDIEYLFDPRGGIKYNVIAHQGADLNSVAIEYEGADSVKKDGVGNILIHTEAGVITEHAPVSYCITKDGLHHPIESAYLINKNTLSFQLTPPTQYSTIVIDPWVNTNLVVGIDDIVELKKDKSANVYALSVNGNITKFDKNGNVVWPLFCSPNVRSIAVTEAGNIYTVAFMSTPDIVKMNTNATVIWTCTNVPDMDEIWDLDINCKMDKLLISGGGVNTSSSFAYVDTLSGSVLSTYKYSGGGGGYDMASLRVNPAGLDIMTAGEESLYGIYYFDQNLNPKWLNSSVKPIQGGIMFGSRSTALINYNNILVVYSGGILRKLNKQTGAIQQQTAFSTGFGGYAGAGVDIDACGENIYSGINNKLYRLDTNLTRIDSVLVAGNIQVILAGDSGRVYTAGNNFVEEVVFSSACYNSLMVTTKAFPQCGALMGAAQITSITGGIPAYTYNWSTGSTNSAISNLTPGVYTLTVIDNNCVPTVHTTSVTVATAPPITVSTITTPVSCSGRNDGDATVLVLSGAAPYSYQCIDSSGFVTDTTFFVDSLAAGNYMFIVTDTNNCMITQSVVVSNPIPIVVTVSANSFICGGQTTVLTANASGGGGPYNYSWQPYGSTVSTISATASGVSGYTVIATDQKNCSSSYAGQLLLFQSPVAYFSAVDTEACSPGCFQFTNQSPSFTSSLWMYSDGSSDTTSNPLQCFSAAGIYSATLVITDTNGCTGSWVKNNYITVHPEPQAGFTSSPAVTSVLSPQVSFIDNSVGATQWTWFIDAETNPFSSLTNPDYVFADTGSYQVMQIVSNSFGCEDTAYSAVRIDPDFIYYIPNTFTPDGNGNNELFIPYMVSFLPEKFKMYIFDRWGQIIFESNDIYKGWNGKVNNTKEMVPVGTYVYLIHATDQRNKQYRITGHVNLIR